MNLPLIAIIVTVITALIVVSLTNKGSRTSLQQWSIAHGNLGSFIMFILVAGEFFTTYTFLGQPGLTYAHGGSVLYMMAFTSILYPFIYYVFPLMWRRGRELKALTIADYFSGAYSSRVMGKLTTLLALIALLAYIAVQISGLSYLTNTLSYGKISFTQAEFLGAIFIILYSVMGGMKGAASVSIIKDILSVGAILVLGVYIPLHLFGSWPNVLHAVEAHYPRFTLVHEPERNYVWFITTGVIATLGYSFWPHTVSSVFSSKSGHALRSSVANLSIYTLISIPVVVTGFTAVLTNPGIPAGKADSAAVAMATSHLPPPLVALIAAAGVLCALVPSAVMCTAMSTALTTQLTPARLRKHENVISRLWVPVFVTAAMIATIFASKSIQQLLFGGYGMIGQFIVAFFCDLKLRGKIPLPAIISGLLVGFILAALGNFINILPPGLPAWLTTFNPGLFALGVNIVVTALVTGIYYLLKRPVKQAV